MNLHKKNLAQYCEKNTVWQTFPAENEIEILFHFLIDLKKMIIDFQFCEILNCN